MTTTATTTPNDSTPRRRPNHTTSTSAMTPTAKTTTDDTAPRPTTNHPPLPSTLPTEIWLEIIPYIPYSPQQHQNLRLTSKHMHTLLITNEQPLVRHWLQQDDKRLQDELSLFPALEVISYTGLAKLWNRTHYFRALQKTVADLITTTDELSWLSGRYEPLFHTGMLLLYRLQDLEPVAKDNSNHGSYSPLSPPNSSIADPNANPRYCAKIALLQSLPKQSLACLLFSLVAAIKVLRLKGPEPVRESWCRGYGEERSEVELAGEECLLLYGPGVLSALLGLGRERHGWAKGLLEKEYHSMPTRQSPYADGTPKPRTLISSLRRELADKCGCRSSEAVTKMWEVVSGTAFDQVGEREMGALVEGKEGAVGEAMKRMGF